MTPRVPLTAPVRRAVPALGVALLAVLLAGCGDDPDAGTNGVGELPAEEIEERARDAAAAASSVRLTGTVISDGHSYELDVRLAEDGAMGEVTSDQGDFELLRVGDDLYLTADRAFWESGAVPEELETDPAEKLDGMYVLVAPEDPAYARLSGFTEMDPLLDVLLALDGERETGDRAEVGGVRTIGVTADGGEGGSMDVALTGEPYPLRFRRGGSAGEVMLREWNDPVELTAPAEDRVVDYGDAILTEDGEGEDDE
ncbi:hypothetical protein [Streptomyces sp. RFCAC02]|uniref:hypothetical protein n=1 Tax=Streptomyces sp. RFCAC02 TaxID=2499143 RepID=UPI00101FE05F|nr:hypothetical protein [Streptomyces sp. RFCAC02]